MLAISFTTGFSLFNKIESRSPSIAEREAKLRLDRLFEASANVRLTALELGRAIYTGRPDDVLVQLRLAHDEKYIEWKAVSESSASAMTIFLEREGFSPLPKHFFDFESHIDVYARELDGMIEKLRHCVTLADDRRYFSGETIGPLRRCVYDKPDVGKNIAVDFEQAHLDTMHCEFGTRRILLLVLEHGEPRRLKDPIVDDACRFRVAIP